MDAGKASFAAAAIAAASAAAAARCCCPLLVDAAKPCPRSAYAQVLNAKAEENAVVLAQSIRDANDAAFVRGLSTQPEHVRATTATLLVCTAVLRTNNPAAASEYPPRVAACVAHAAMLGYQPRQPNHEFAACRDLLVLCLQHPGFDAGQHQTFMRLLSTLESLQMVPGRPAIPPAVVATPASSSMPPPQSQASSAASASTNAWTKGPPTIQQAEAEARARRRPLQPQREAPLPPPPGAATDGQPPAMAEEDPEEEEDDGPFQPPPSGRDRPATSNRDTRRFSDDGFESECV